MVDLTARPFFLSRDAIHWVESTIVGMTPEEKVGQLFIHMNTRRDPEYIRGMCEKYHIGGLRWEGASAEEVHEQNRLYQSLSKVPMLFAANCETGGARACREGTTVAPAAACGACASTKTARDMGAVGGREGAAIGCNWTFTPVADILLNWRNTIVNTRSFGSDPDRVQEMSKAYMEGVHESEMLCCAKHFPGDGSEERDQHLVMGCNDLSCEDWDATYGTVYKGLIDAGLESVMIGHICQPAYSRKFKPGVRDEDILPATLAPELIQGLLRGRLGFNGLIVTDASRMAGMTCAMPRREQVPRSIAAGCDMFLFFGDPDEDFGYMLEGVRSGVITQERLNDALLRILGAKARLGLHKKAFPPKEGLAVVGCEEHRLVAEEAADASVTLVKDTQNLLPVNPLSLKRARVHVLENNQPRGRGGADPTKQIIVEELERAGFQVSLYESAGAFDPRNPSPENIARATRASAAKDFAGEYDILFVFVNMGGFAQENNVRVRWQSGLGNEALMFAREVPSVCVSLNFTNHLIDLPMYKTFVNAYSPTREYVRAAVEKIVGKSAFKGKADELVWCGRWDTRL